MPEIPQQDNNSELKASIDELTKAVDNLIEIFRTASTDVHSENSDLGKRFDILIDQNRQMAQSLITLLEVQKESLTRLSSESAFRKKIAPMPSVNPMSRIESKIFVQRQPEVIVRPSAPSYTMVEQPTMREESFQMMPPPIRPPELQEPKPVKLEEDPLQSLSLDLPDFPEQKKERKLFG